MLYLFFIYLFINVTVLILNGNIYYTLLFFIEKVSFSINIFFLRLTLM